MKKIFFLFALLASITASATVTVTPLSVDYSTQKITFSVSWTGTAANNRAWVWVDLCPVTGTTAGAFAKAEISGATATAGNIDAATLNGRGFYVTANPSTVTATLSNASGNFNWCAYGSDYPPNAVDNSSGGYALKGSPPFIITTSAGTTEVNATTFSGGTITALTDATGCPGVLCGKNNESSGLLNCCAYGTTNCSRTCKTTLTYTTNDGACAGTCNTAYVRLPNQCGTVINATYGTYTNTACTTPNYTTKDGACAGTCNTAYVRLRNECGTVINATYSTYTNTACTTPNYTTEDGECTGTCNTAYVQQRNACGAIINPQHGTYTTPACSDGCTPVYDANCEGTRKWTDIGWDRSRCVTSCTGYRNYSLILTWQYCTNGNELGELICYDHYTCYCCN